VALFGFKTREEKELFIKLIDVKGIGPKTAINILSATTPTNLIQAIETSNTGYLRNCQELDQKQRSKLF
jgi:Holliday junction DNA helicase RuvA